MRKSPIKHRVRSHKRSGRNVHSYIRGHRLPLSHIAHQIKLAHKPLHSKIQRQLNKKLLRTQEGFKIYLVDGDVVRKYFWEDFWRGAHGEGLLQFIPHGEIWVEKKIKPENKHEELEEKVHPGILREGVIQHEIVEAHLMKDTKEKGLPYELAHAKYATPAEEHYKKSVRSLGQRRIQTLRLPEKYAELEYGREWAEKKPKEDERKEALKRVYTD